MKKRLPRAVRALLGEVKARLSSIYGERLRGLVLYGSYARGGFTDESDIDLMLLLDDVKDPSAERRSYFERIWELDLKHDTLLSVIPVKEEDFRTRRLPIFVNARREGIAV